MKRLAVSLLFTLVAASFVPDAAIAFGKLKSRAGKHLGCSAMAYHAVSSSESARKTASQISDWKEKGHRL